MENEFSVLIGGKAGDGINQAGLLIARLLNQLGYRLYGCTDYPSLIRGGHNFSIIRAASGKIAVHRDKIDCLLALNQDTIDFHQHRLKDNAFIIYDSDTVHLPSKSFGVGVGLPLGQIIKEANAPAITRNSCLIGGLAKAVGIPYDILEGVFRKNILKETDLNLKLASRGYENTKELAEIKQVDRPALPVLTGNEALSLGLLQAGLKTYISYPMTPSSSILHFLAQAAEDFGLKVIHPESEIGVVLMALGFSYAGEKTAVGTSGGGFCLMTEGLSFAGMAELPVVIVVSQRPGPSTGLPTYTAQGDLHFVLNAGQGDFPRFVVAPGDAEESYFWSAVALNVAWKYQMPSIILMDKTLSEGTYSFDISSVPEVKDESPVFWDRKQPYQRYAPADSGVSPLTFPPDKEAVIKINSYERDESGITTEDPQKTRQMNDKRLRKVTFLAEELEERYPGVKIYGDKKSKRAVVCWGSNKGVCVEVGEMLGLKVIQPVVLNPFPVGQFKSALQGVEEVICVENNAGGQLVRLLNTYGFRVDKKILKYDGRPFGLEELEEAVKSQITNKF